MPRFQARHYNAIAALLKTMRDDALDHGDMFLLETIAVFARRIADTFVRDNPRFKPERFWSAIGYENGEPRSTYPVNRKLST